MEQYQTLEKIWQACSLCVCDCVVAQRFSSLSFSLHLPLHFLLNFQYSLLFYPYIHLPLFIPSGSFLPPPAFCYHGRLKGVIFLNSHTSACACGDQLPTRNVWQTLVISLVQWCQLQSWSAGVEHRFFIPFHCIIYHLSTCLLTWILKHDGLYCIWLRLGNTQVLSLNVLLACV